MWVAVLVIQPWFWGEPSIRLLSQRGWETRQACEQVLAIADPEGVAECREITKRP
jgi:hypothetical protein